MLRKSIGKIQETWEGKYYEQLDHMDRQDQEWKNLEAVLKRAIGHLCIVATGHDPRLDKHIDQIRQATRKTIEIRQLDELLDQMSESLIRCEDDTVQSNQKITAGLKRLIDNLEFPAWLGKRKGKMSRYLATATDAEVEQLIDEIGKLFQAVMDAEKTRYNNRPNWLTRIFQESALNYDSTSANEAHVLVRLHTAIDWPASMEKEVHAFKQRLQNDVAQDSKLLLTDFSELVNCLRYSTYSARHTEAETEIQRRLLLLFIDRLQEDIVSREVLADLKSKVTAASDHTELDTLSQSLAELLNESHRANDDEAKHDPGVPRAQELLLQLLEQLIIPTELEDAVAAIKHRLEENTAPEDWRTLLRDVAALLNDIRTHVQEEKQDFESFLQQVTERLQVIDTFLQGQSSSLQHVEESNKQLDQDISVSFDDIRDDMHAARDLNELKRAVEMRIDTMMQHIKNHRLNEQRRFEQAQQSLEDTQARLDALQQESHSLKSMLREKHRESQQDTLTRIPNRLAIEQQLSDETARWQRFGTPLTLAMLDIDHFKHINDEYGHQAGDKALRTIAQLLLQRIRQTDFLGRYGGEEFVMLLPGTSEQQAFAVVNELCGKVAASGFHYHGLPVSITMSAGLSEFRQADTSEEVLERADKALYAAKQNGRNQCVLAPQAPL